MNAVPFEFATAGRILFGPGVADRVAPEAASLGGRALLVTGATPRRHDSLIAELIEAGLVVAPLSVSGEPGVEDLRTGTRLARTEKCDVVIAVGGGSVLDAAKAIGGLIANEGDPLDYVEVVGRGRQFTRRSVPMIAVPTTAGTGSEVTRNAVVRSEEHAVKVSLRSPLLLPHLAVVDPLMTVSMPAETTVSSGLDALTHLVESYLSARANPLVDPLCLAGIRLVAGSLRTAVSTGDDLGAREAMARASLFGGLALANSGLGAVHGLAGVLGGRYRAPHGMVCGRLLPFVFEANLRAVRQRTRDDPVLDRFDEVAGAVTGEQAAEGAVEWFHELSGDLRVPPLTALGFEAADTSQVVEAALGSSSMRGNPVALSAAGLEEILGRAG